MDKKGHHNEKHKVLKTDLTFGQKSADILTTVCGSWYFIFGVLSFLVVWMSVNIYLIVNNPFDPYPFILLNFVLSCLAALQAPIILMSQNREAERDRINARYDYLVNRKAEREILQLQKDVSSIARKLSKKR
jgi:uncharacterized membrane protein